jgi:hypothetical protein
VAVGYTIDKATLDNRAGALVTACWTDLDEIRKFKSWLDDAAHNTAYMTGTIGYTTADDTLLRAAFTDLDKLRQIAHAGATQSAANDFFFSAKALTGITFTG